MNDLLVLCHLAAEKKRYWPYLEAHVRLWWVLDKLGKV